MFIFYTYGKKGHNEVQQHSKHKLEEHFLIGKIQMSKMLGANLKLSLLRSNIF